MKKILIVDDNPDIVELMQIKVKSVLKDFDIIIDTAVNGMSARSKIQRTAYYDLILMDMKMPIMTGPEILLSCYNQYPYVKRVSIIVTGYDKQYVENNKFLNIIDMYNFEEKIPVFHKQEIFNSGYKKERNDFNEEIKKRVMSKVLVA